MRLPRRVMPTPVHRETLAPPLNGAASRLPSLSMTAPVVFAWNLLWRRRVGGHRAIFRRWTMDSNRIEGSWSELKGKAKQQWGNLTDNELTQIGGKKDELI